MQKYFETLWPLGYGTGTEMSKKTSKLGGGSGVAREWLGGFLSGWLGVGSEAARGWLGGFASWWLGGGSEVARGWFKHVRGIIKNKKKCGM